MAPKAKTSANAFSSSSADDLNRVLARLQSDGRTQEVLEVLQLSFGSPVEKRNRDLAGQPWDNEDEDEDFGYERVQAPVAPAAAAGNVQLPTGVNSVTQWGNTLCVLPKVAALKLSYSELVLRAVEDKEVRSYLDNFVRKYQGTSARVKDLRLYLEASQGAGPVLYYEGSSEVRRFKE